ncbi:MAG: hypothetical protein J5543_04050 [Bacteroidales bacterium]|nr:hypothetical protein [Bacteroidales bacterium]
MVIQFCSGISAFVVCTRDSGNCKIEADRRITISLTEFLVAYELIA